jgi:transposase
VRLQRESGESITAVAKRLGMSPETLRNWVRRDEIERGERGTRVRSFMFHWSVS